MNYSSCFRSVFCLLGQFIARGGGLKAVLPAATMLSMGFASLAQNAPVINLEPTNQTVEAGGAASFSVVVSGAGPFSYQWQIDGITLPDLITTVAGNGTQGYSGDGGAATYAKLYGPAGLAVDNLGNLFMADSSDLTAPVGGDNRVRKVDAAGVITTIAGNGIQGYSGDGGAATNASLYTPVGLAVDSVGSLFIADYANQRVRKVDPKGIITTVAGGGTNSPGDGGAATNAALGGPAGVAVDGSGNLFIADLGRKVVRKVNARGIITTVAGGGTNPVVNDGPATSVELNYPTGVAVDGSGNVFIADAQRVWKLGTNGLIACVAGTGVEGYSGDGGAAANARIFGAREVATDDLGNLFIADQRNNRVRQVDTNGIITTVAGGGDQNEGDGGLATDAEVSQPAAVAVERSGELFIADTGNHRIRAVLPYGPTLAVNNANVLSAGDYDVIVTGPSGSVSSSVATLTVVFPPEIVGQPANQFVPAGHGTTLAVSATGTTPLAYQWYLGGARIAGQTNAGLALTNLAVAASGGYSVVVTNLYGSTTSAAAVLTVGLPPALTTQPTGQTAPAGGGANFTVAVSGTGPFQYQWQFNGANIPDIITVAGNGSEGDTGDGGPATKATLTYPYGVAVDRWGDLFIPQTAYQIVRKVAANGIITRVAGDQGEGDSGDGGPALEAGLDYPSAVAVDGFGNLFIADANSVRKVDTNGIITTVAGGGYLAESAGGAATNTALASPSGVAVDGLGNLFIADYASERVLKVGANGILSTVAGVGTKGYSGDGGPAAQAELNSPSSVAVDVLGNLFIADGDNQRVRKVGIDGIITTVAGGGNSYPGDGGPATDVQLDPSCVAVDALGNLFIADSAHQRVRVVGANGLITTVAGNGVAGWSGDGGPAADAEVNYPFALAADGSGNLFVADTYNQIIREVANYAYGPSLAVGNATIANAGSYAVVVTSPFGTVTSSTATLTVVAPFSLQAQVATGNVVLLHTSGAPGQLYVLESTASLVAPVVWQPVYTNASDASGAWSFTNSALAAQPALFYRLAVP